MKRKAPLHLLSKTITELFSTFTDLSAFCCSIHSFVWLLLLSVLEIRWCGVCLDSSVLRIARFYFVAWLHPVFLPIQLLVWWGASLHLWTRSSNQFFKNSYFGIWYKRHWNLGSQRQRTGGEALIASNLKPRDPLHSQMRVRVDSISMVKKQGTEPLEEMGNLS